MDRRIRLHEAICKKFGEIGIWVWDPFNFETDNVTAAIRNEAPKHVYFQPPASLKLAYPCIVYKLEDIPQLYANNMPYQWYHAYQLTVIDRDPESKIREKIAELQTAKFQRFFVADNLNHFVFRIYDVF